MVDGIISKLVFLFESNAKQATDDMAKAQGAADDLAASVENVGEVKVDAAGLEKLSAALQNAKTQAETLGAAASRAKFEGRTEEAEKFARLSEHAKIEAQEIQAAMNRVKYETAGANANAKALATSFLNAAKAFVLPLAAGLSASGVANFVRQTAAEVKELDQVSTKLRSRVEDVDAFRRAVTATGGESGKALDTLQKFSVKLNEAGADAKSGAAKDFAEWGFKIKDSKGNVLGTTEAVLKFAGSLEKLDKAKALARLKKLEIEDPATIALLLKGRTALEERIAQEKELGVVTEEQVLRTREYYEQVGRLQNAWEGFTNRVFLALIPHVTRAFERLNQFFSWLGRNERLVTGFFIGVATVITAVYLPAVLRAAAATLALLAPYLLIIAAVAAFGALVALVYEDVQAWLKGENSLLGELIKKYPELGEAIKALGEAWETIKATAAEVWAAVTKAADDAVQALKGFWDAWGPTIIEGLRSIRDVGVDTWNGLVNAGKQFLEAIKPLLDALGNLGRLLGEIGEAIGGELARELENAGKAFKMIFEAIFGDFDNFKEVAKSAAGFVGDTFVAAAKLIGGAWKVVLDGIAAGINFVVDGARRLLNLGGSVPTAPSAPAGGGTTPETPAAGGGGAPAAPSAPAGGGSGERTWRDKAGDVLFGTTVPQPMGKQSVIRGQQLMQTASAAPTNTMLAPGAMAREAAGAGDTTVNRETNVQVGDVTINTQATDAQGIAAAFRDQLASEIRQTQSNLDDGVAA